MRAHRGLVLALVALLVAPSAALAATDDASKLAIPRAGDRGTYTLVDPLPRGAEAPDGDKAPVLRFAIDHPELRTDAYGTQRELFPVTLDPAPEAAPTGPQDRAWQPWTTWLLHRGAGPIATDQPAPPSHGFTFTAGPLGDGDDDGPRASGQLRYAHAAQALDGPACWLVAVISAERFGPGLADALAPCGRALAQAAATNGTALSIQADPVQRLTDGSEQVTLHVTVDQPGLEAQLSLTYRSTVPVPTRIQLEAQHAPGVADPAAFSWVWDEIVRPIDELTRGPDPGERTPGTRGEPIEATLELSRFSRGDGPRLPAGELVDWPNTRESLHRAPVTTWGPKDGGDTFELTRAEASSAIEADPTLSEFHDWRETHPEARAILASHQVLDEGRTEAWSFWFVAPDRTAWAIRSERQLDAGIEAVRDPVERATIVNDAEQMQRFPPCPAGCTFDVTPALDRVPTIRSAIEIWQREASITSGTSTPSAYVWVQSPWFGEMRIAAGWGPSPGDAWPPTLPTARDVRGGGNASAILVSPHDGALTERQGLETQRHVDPLPASATLAPAAVVDEGSPGATLALVAAGVATLAAIATAVRTRRGR